MPRATEPAVDIVDYSAVYGDAFERLNVEWLEKYFEVEPIDVDMLGDPETYILADGGAILYAVVDDEPVGTAALKAWGEGVFELTKMAVTRRYQGLGIGRLLLAAAIRRYEALGGERLFLESNSALAPALALYESAGFEHESPPGPSDYSRADVYMVYRREARAGPA